MSELDLIKQPIVNELDAFEKSFKSALKSNVLLLDKVTGYLLKKKGKQLRPILVFLSSKINGEISESTNIAASLIEMLHSATLIHDDVVDNANERRGMFSINALWKNKISVLVGDFMLSKGLLLALDKDEFQLLKIVSNAVREMSEGELLQIEKARTMNVAEDVYFEVIRKKTASLFASCCASGAASAGADSNKIELMRQFGEYLGIAFQIKDDLFDYEDNKSGKTKGLDIKEQKVTLPLIYTLSHCSFSERRFLINTVKNDSSNNAKIDKLTNLIIEKGGVRYSYEKIDEYVTAAQNILKNNFPESQARESLLLLTEYVIKRDK